MEAVVLVSADVEVTDRVCVAAVVTAVPADVVLPVTVVFVTDADTAVEDVTAVSVVTVTEMSAVVAAVVNISTISEFAEGSGRFAKRSQCPKPSTVAIQRQAITGTNRFMMSIRFFFFS